jgi:hypothetical protein
MFSAIKLFRTVICLALLVGLLLITSGNPVDAQPKPKVQVKIRHPRDGSKNAVPPTFIAVVSVKAKKKDINLKAVDAEVSDKSGSKVANSVVNAIGKVEGHEQSKHPRFFLLVMVPTPDPASQNPYTLTVRVPVNMGEGLATSTFNIKIPAMYKMPLTGQRPFDPKGIVEPHYPTEFPFPITGSEREYFVPCGYSPYPIVHASLGGVEGIPHYNDDDPNYPIWWVEFTGLSAIPGPGDGYPLIVVNAHGQSIESEPTVNVAEDDP